MATTTYAAGDRVEIRSWSDEDRPAADRMWWPATYVQRGLPKHHVVRADRDGESTSQVHRDDLRRAV